MKQLKNIVVILIISILFSNGLFAQLQLAVRDEHG